MKKVTTNQICGLIMLVTISNKLLILPALMYEDAGVDAIFLVVLKIMLAFVAFWIFAYLAKHYPNKTLDDLLVPYIGKFCYGVLLFLFGVFYLIKTFLTLSEGEMFLGETIYISLPTELYAIPTFVVAGYFVYKGAMVIGRTNETVFRVIFWGVVISILLTFPNLNLETLLPMFTAPANDFFRAFSHISMWFGNYFVVYMFLGKIETSEHFIAKVLKSFFLSAGVVLAFFTVYYCVFGESSIIHSYAINDVVTLTPQLSSLIKIDWFTVIFYSMALIGQVILQLYLVFMCVQKIFRVKATKLSVSIFIAILTIAFLIMPFSNVQIINFCSEGIGFYCFILNLIFPMLVLLVLLIENNKRAKGQIKGGTNYALNTASNSANNVCRKESAKVVKNEFANIKMPIKEAVKYGRKQKKHKINASEYSQSNNGAKTTLYANNYANKVAINKGENNLKGGGKNGGVMEEE